MLETIARSITDHLSYHYSDLDIFYQGMYPLPVMIIQPPDNKPGYRLNIYFWYNNAQIEVEPNTPLKLSGRVLCASEVRGATHYLNIQEPIPNLEYCDPEFLTKLENYCAWCDRQYKVESRLLY